MTGTDDQRGEGAGRESGAMISERTLWRRSAAAEVAVDEAERFLDLAGFADGQLDPDEQERIAERLVRDSDAVADIEAARALVERGVAEGAPAHVIARACALVEGTPKETASVIPFRQRYTPRPTLPGVARWAGLAAALVVASWLGFDLGSTASATFGSTLQPPEDSLVRDMLDPSAGFVRDLTEGTRT